MESLDTCAYKWHKCAWQQIDYNVTNTNTPKVSNDVEEQFSSPSLNLWDLMGCSHPCKFTFSLVLPVWIHLRWKHLHSHHYQANITMRSKANCWITPFNMTRFYPKFLQLSMKPIFRHHSEGSYKESIDVTRENYRVWQWFSRITHRLILVTLDWCSVSSLPMWITVL